MPASQRARGLREDSEEPPQGSEGLVMLPCSYGRVWRGIPLLPRLLRDPRVHCLLPSCVDEGVGEPELLSLHTDKNNVLSVIWKSNIPNPQAWNQRKRRHLNPI